MGQEYEAVTKIYGAKTSRYYYVYISVIQNVHNNEFDRVFNDTSGFTISLLGI